MNIRDISKPVTAQSLNESLEKKFGKRVKLETFTLEQLHNSRNKLRTALSQIETNESYGAVNTSETYQKNKLFLDVLNAEISEREDVEVDEKAESEAQQKAAGAALAAKRGKISKSELTGASREMLDMSETDLEDFAGTKHSDIPTKKETVTSEGTGDSLFGMHNVDNVESVIDRVRQIHKTLTKGGYKTNNQKLKDALSGDTSKVKQDGNRGASYTKNESPEIIMSYGRDLKGDYFVNVNKSTNSAASESSGDTMRLPFEGSFDNVPPEDENDLDYEGGMAMKQLSTIDDAADELTDLIGTDENLPEWVQKKIILAMSYIDTARDYMKSAGAVDRERTMGMESVIREGAEDKAELVMAAKNMVDKLTGWMEDTAEMQTETMLELGDAIRDELGENESQQFTSTVKPSLESLYTAMESTRSDLVTGVRMVAGEEVPDMPGDDMDAEPEMEPTIDQEEGDLDTNLDLDTDDDFAAADAAVGGEEEAGREKRESIERPRRLAKMFASKKK